MAGKELKATEKTVLKHSREGVLEQNLVDGSAKKVSNKAEEAVLKTARPDDERFDELKAAGLVVENVKKPDHRKLQFGRNNPDNTWAEAVYGNKPVEQSSFISNEQYQNSETTVYDDHFYCFGCGKHGDVTDMVSELFGISSKEAAEKIAHDFGIRQWLFLNKNYP